MLRKNNGNSSTKCWRQAPCFRVELKHWPVRHPSVRWDCTAIFAVEDRTMLEAGMVPPHPVYGHCSNAYTEYIQTGCYDLGKWWIHAIKMGIRPSDASHGCDAGDFLILRNLQKAGWAAELIAEQRYPWKECRKGYWTKWLLSVPAELPDYNQKPITSCLSSQWKNYSYDY